jgi:hypothetical protein
MHVSGSGTELTHPTPFPIAITTIGLRRIIFVVANLDEQSGQAASTRSARGSADCGSRPCLPISGENGEKVAKAAALHEKETPDLRGF